MLLYSLLHLTGYDLSLEELMKFRQWGSKTPGHPENTVTPGVEMATGPLGQGFATAVGMAIAERFLSAKFNTPKHHVVDHYTYVIASDGDLMEGITNEAASLAGHLNLDKLIVLYDDNSVTIDGSTSLAFSEDVPARFEALGWWTKRIDGMSISEVDAAISEAKRSGRPSIIAAKTVIGFGSPNKAGTSKSHGSPLGEEEVRLTKQALGIPVETQFWVHPDARSFLGSFRDAGEALEAKWNQELAAYSESDPDLAREFAAARAGEISSRLLESMPTFDSPVQTRQASGKVIQAISESLPTFIGGSADLAESNQTLIASSEPMSATNPAGRNIFFGVREHAMAAATNGMNLHGGVKAFCASFLIFSDYCRPSIRLAALMECPTVFVFTHDSIGVGEDGPTHQPIEHYMSLRAIPNLNFMRPADGNETAACWLMALRRTDGPSVLALTRQPLPAISPRALPNHPAMKGAYVISEAQSDPVACLLATGSEVSVCIEAQRLLAEKGVSVRVVSMPSWYVFESQTPEYRNQVIPQGLLRISVEAGVTLGWERYADHSIGLNRFGESAPYQEIMSHFGFTPERVTAEVMKHMLDAVSIR